MFITPEFGGMSGGIGTSLLSLARELASGGQRVTVVTRYDSGQATEQPFTVHRVRCRRGHLARWGFRAAAGLQSCIGRPDVIHAPEWNAAAVCAAAFGRTPVVTRLDTPSYLVRTLTGQTTQWNQRIVERAERLQAQRSTLVLAASEAIGNLVSAEWNLDSERVRLLRNPIDFARLRRLADQSKGGASSTGLVFLGRLEPRKGLALLLPVIWMLLVEAIVPVTIIGSQANLDLGTSRQLDRLIRCFPKTLTVRRALPHDECLRVLARAEAVIVPSVWENAPLVIMEALALGRPTFASAAGGIPELIRDGVDGILITSRDPSVWFGRIVLELGDQRRLRSLSACAVERARQWDASIIAKEATKFYVEAINNG